MTIRDIDRGAKRLVAMAKRRTPSVRVGIMGSEASEKKQGGSAGATLVDIASYHEFGRGNNERRSFIADWADESEAEALKKLRSVFKMAIKSGGFERNLNLFGLWAQGGIQKRIAQGIAPELKASTKARKKVRGKSGNTPLIDTGQLRSSITYDVHYG